jgi:hypothetical protein
LPGDFGVQKGQFAFQDHDLQDYGGAVVRGQFTKRVAEFFADGPFRDLKGRRQHFPLGENESAFGLAFKDTIDDGYPVDRKRKLAVGEGGTECRAGVEALTDGFVQSLEGVAIVLGGPRLAAVGIQCGRCIGFKFSFRLEVREEPGFGLGAPPDCLHALGETDELVTPRCVGFLQVPRAARDVRGLFG